MTRSHQPNDLEYPARTGAEMKFLDKYGWPVVLIEGRPVLNFIRRLIHTRKIVRKWEHKPMSDETVQTRRTPDG